jgi:hypothetical protein
MSWILYQTNVLLAMATFRFADDPDGIAEFISKEYDSCIKRGGDMVYGVPVLNGNVSGMKKIISDAFKKGFESDGDNFNLLEEIYPAAFDAYWLKVEMAPIPNPLLNPGGWPTTPPARGTIANIGPDPISMISSAAINKAEVEVMKVLVDELKKQTITIPGVPPLPNITIPVYETVEKILKKEPVDKKIKNHPAVKAAKEIIFKFNEAKKKKPSIGKQVKKAIKFPFPKLPKRKDLIKQAEDKAIEEATKIIEEQIIKPLEEIILTPIYAAIETAVAIADNIPKPKPTKAEIKKFVKDTIEGLVPEIDLPGISIPKIPTKPELKKMIKDQTPTKEQLKAMAFDLIKGLIPNIPLIYFVPPTLVFTPQTILFLNPFVNLAKFHLTGVSGTMMVLAQYPPPALPNKALINWTGYRVVG